MTDAFNHINHTRAQTRAGFSGGFLVDVAGSYARSAHQPGQRSRLSWREKISYGLADMGFNFFWTNIAL